MNNIFRKKTIASLLADANDTEKGMKRTLSATSLIALGIGAIIGAGLFVRTAAAAAEHGGPSVTYGFIIAAIGCACAGLCYAELSSSIPIAGSAYTYTYATMGELVAWIIGWDLVLEYAVGAATVGIAWSEYLNNLLTSVLHWKAIPYEWCHSPFQKMFSVSGSALSNFPAEISAVANNGVAVISNDAYKLLAPELKAMVTSTSGIMNLPALFIVTLMSLLLIKGTQESAIVNGLIVIAKVMIVILVIILGWGFINQANHTPYIPEPYDYTTKSGVTHKFGGFMGILGSAGVVFFAFIGFDAVSTAAQEAKNPKRDMPIGILGSLAICTVLYILFAHVLTGIAPVKFFREAGGEASVAKAIATYMPGYGWLAKFITVAILAGFSSVILVMLLGQSRVFYSMAKDGLIPTRFADLHEKFRTPYKASLFVLIIVGLFAAFIPGDVVGDMSSIGTLFAFILVCIGVMILRKTNPDMKREFVTPWVPAIPIIGIFFCLMMIFGLGWLNWLRLLAWLALGLIIYFAYSVHNSKLNKDRKED
jgi:basic amino acid/polyamine antiporter, APA family